MPQSRTHGEFKLDASLSQIIAKRVIRYDKEIYPLLAGADQGVSLKIARLMVLRENHLLDMIPAPLYSLIMQFLDMERIAKFATSSDVNEISKMGMQHPKEDPAYGEDEDEE